MPAYAELQVLSNFTFLQGASHPQEYALTAAALGYSAFALCDRNSLAGVVRAHLAAKQAGIRFVVGARLDLVQDLRAFEARPLDRERKPRPTDGLSLLAYPIDRTAYSRLSKLISLGRRRAPRVALLPTRSTCLHTREHSCSSTQQEQWQQQLSQLLLAQFQLMYQHQTVEQQQLQQKKQQQQQMMLLMQLFQQQRQQRQQQLWHKRP